MPERPACLTILPHQTWPLGQRRELHLPGLNFRYSIEDAAWPTEARADQAIKLPKQTRVTPDVGAGLGRVARCSGLSV